METRQIVIGVSEKVLLAEKANEASFARELRILAAMKLYELGRLFSRHYPKTRETCRV